MWRRRDFLKASAAAALVACDERPRSLPPDRRRGDAAVAILRAADYDAPLEDLLDRGLRELRVDVRGRRVVLKPNFVEYDPAGVINTHPLLVAAAIEVFRRHGALEVVVAEGPGHRRDNEYILHASGLDRVVRDRGVRYVDLNFDSVERRRLDHPLSSLRELWLPRTVLDADLLVSMPKLKTHHWAGVTLSMKNLFGIAPGAIYGWPKNVLHWAGLEETIVDLNAVLDVPRLAIVDGILGMDGNGPIQGEPRHAGVVVMGEDFVAVDATCARLMRIEPDAVRYLAWAGTFLGHVGRERITQRGEGIEALAVDFRVLPRFAHLKR